VLADLRKRPILEHAREALGRLRKTIRRRGRGGLDRLDPVSRHKLRIRAKRLRYAVEFFAPVFDGPRGAKTAFLDALKKMQDQLGALNDIVVARQRILPALEPCTPDIAFAAGRIVGRREAKEAKLLRAAARDFREFRDAEPFWRERSGSRV
jgi:CHAD domain-containing protein